MFMRYTRTSTSSIKMNKLTIITLLLPSLFIVGCKNNAETITPKITNIVESVYASGVVKSKNQYDVFTKINGKIETIFVVEGQLVQKGDPLFKIENKNSNLTADNALLLALANDYKLNEEKLSEARNAIDLAQNKLTYDSLLFTRQQELWRQNIGAKVELEQKELSFINAKVNLKKAKVAYNDLQRQLKLASDQSKNNLRIAQSNESDLIIRSEVTGYIYKINAKRGEQATSMSPLAVVGKENFIIELNVDEIDIVNIRKEQKLIVKMDSYKGQIFEAQVSFIYPIMNERTRTFRVEAIFSKEPDVLYPNLTLEANIIINVKKNVLTIPTRYLLNDSTVILKDGTTKQIKIGLQDYTLTEIVSGLDETSEISISNQ